MKKILLLSMPFGAMERPALGLSLEDKQAVNKARLRVEKSNRVKAQFQQSF